MTELSIASHVAFLIIGVLLGTVLLRVKDNLEPPL